MPSVWCLSARRVSVVNSDLFRADVVDVICAFSGLPSGFESGSRLFRFVVDVGKKIREMMGGIGIEFLRKAIAEGYRGDRRRGAASATCLEYPLCSTRTPLIRSGV